MYNSIQRIVHGTYPACFPSEIIRVILPYNCSYAVDSHGLILGLIARVDKIMQNWKMHVNFYSFI